MHCLNNCIAHPDYTVGSWIYVHEFEDKLIITNLGTFIPRETELILKPSYTCSFYRNQLLAESMVMFKMIDYGPMGTVLFDPFWKDNFSEISDKSGDCEGVRMLSMTHFRTVNGAVSRGLMFEYLLLIRKEQSMKKIIFIMCASLLLWNAICLGYSSLFTANASENSSEQYLIPGSELRYITEAELAGMTPQILRYARNEIFAKHGRIFNSQELSGYFNLMPWYKGTIPANQFDESVFNDFERKNINLIAEKEDGAYILDQAGYSYDPVFAYLRTVENGISTGSVSSNGFDVTTFAGVPFEEAAKALGFSSVFELPNPYTTSKECYAFKYEGEIVPERNVNDVGDVYYTFPEIIIRDCSFIWGFSDNNVHWELYIRDPGYTFYGIEVGMNENEAKRIASGIPNYTALGLWYVLYDKGVVKEIHTYYEN